MKNSRLIFFFNKAKKTLITAAAVFVGAQTTAQINIATSVIIRDSSQTIIHQKQWRHTLDTAQINQEINRLIINYANTGYPFAKAVCDSVVINQGKAVFNYTVSTGKYFKISNIYLPESPKISPKYIYRTVYMSPEKEFSQRRLHKTDALINNTGILTCVRNTQTEFHPDGADIFIYLQKQKANSAEAGIALMYDDQKGKYYPTGNAHLRLANNLGKGEIFGFDWHGYKQNSQKLTTNILLPYLFGSVISAEGDARIDKTDTSCVFVSLNPRLHFAISEFASVSTDITSTWLIPEGEESSVGKTQGTLYGADIQWLLANHQSIFKASAGAAIGSRNHNGEKDPCQELRMNLAYSRTIARRFEISTQAKSRAKFCSSETYLHEKYRFGGNSSLRGFDENYFYADSYITLSNTVRYRPYGYFSLFVFYDIAAYRCQKINDTPSGTGIGAGLTQNNTDIDLTWALGREHGEFLPLKQAKITVTFKVIF